MSRLSTKQRRAARRRRARYGPSFWRQTYRPVSISLSDVQRTWDLIDSNGEALLRHYEEYFLKPLYARLEQLLRDRGLLGSDE